MCVKVMVQAGIRKIYYFPAKHWELEGEEGTPPSPDSVLPPTSASGSPRKPGDRKEKNSTAIQRLVMNNSIALSMYIPQWTSEEGPRAGEAGVDLGQGASSLFPLPLPFLQIPQQQQQPPAFWELDPAISLLPNIEGRWPTIQARFQQTLQALQALTRKYQVPCEHWRHGTLLHTSPTDPVYSHAIVLAHLIAKRTDDPKVGVGAVLLLEGPERRYISVGWNGFPRKAQHLDYPYAGADDSAEDERLKYLYILHAGRRGLVWCGRARLLQRSRLTPPRDSSLLPGATPPAHRAECPALAQPQGLPAPQCHLHRHQAPLRRVRPHVA
jgi:deoxycytidylate deaminase